MRPHRLCVTLYYLYYYYYYYYFRMPLYETVDSSLPVHVQGVPSAQLRAQLHMARRPGKMECLTLE